MRRKISFCFLSLFLISSVAYADTAIIARIPDAQIAGIGTMRYAFSNIYQATLYAPKGQWNPSLSYGLSITYYYAIKGKNIADRSVEEIRNQGFKDEITLAAWHTQMATIFPDVANGTVLSAIYTPGVETAFFKNNAFIGTIRGDLFAKHFFGIWLNEKTSEPSLRKDLLGIKR